MINARLDPEQGALVVKALQAAGEALRVAEDDSREELTGVGARGEGRDDSREELMTPDVAREPATARRADALVLMAETLLAQDATALAAGDQHLPSRACGASTPVMSSYVPLWLKSNFSFLEGASAPDELVERAHALGLPTLALSDRDGVYGIVRAHMRAQELGIALVIAAGTQPGTGCLCTPNHGPRPARASPRDPLPDTRAECYL